MHSPRSPLSNYGTASNPIDLTGEDAEFQPSRHWSKLFEEHLSGARETHSFTDGSSCTSAINNNGTVMVQEKPKGFRINAKSVFLTYPKCLLTKEELLHFFNDLRHKYKYVIICIENHKDGTPHLHAVIKFDKKIDIKKETYFDFKGYHPNIQTTKNINASINYIKKDGNFLEDGVLEMHTNAIPTRGGLPEYNEVYSFDLHSLLVGYE
jgi:hypothetical protein